MLSYKLKHLCSRMIASLSAVGLFSVNTGAAQAATYTYQPGDMLKAYNVLGNTTFSANMTEMQAVDYCLTGKGVENVARVGFNGWVCTYECASGYAFLNATKDQSGVAVTTLTGDVTLVEGEYQPYTLNDSCSWGVYATCHTSGENSHVESSGYITGEFPECQYRCEQGYHASISTPTGVCADGTSKGCGEGSSGWVETGKAGDVYTAYSCLPNKYVLKFDCGSGQISGTTSSTMSKDAVYNSSFAIPNEAVCILDGFKMEGWNSDKEFEIEK